MPMHIDIIDYNSQSYPNILLSNIVCTLCGFENTKTHIGIIDIAIRDPKIFHDNVTDKRTMLFLLRTLFIDSCRWKLFEKDIKANIGSFGLWDAPTPRVIFIYIFFFLVEYNGAAVTLNDAEFSNQIVWQLSIFFSRSPSIQF